jgi:biopolymer transport protein ExbD
MFWWLIPSAWLPSSDFNLLTFTFFLYPFPMAFVLNRRLQPVRGLIDLVPIVTVVLLLLAFFLLSSSFVLQPGIKVEPPRSAFGGGTPLSRLIVAVTLPPPQVDANGAPVKQDPILFFNDQIVTLDGFRAALDKMQLSRVPPSLVIKADKGVTLETVMSVEDIAFAHRLPVVLATQPN